MSDIDPIVKAAVDAWLGEVENFGLRAERVPEGALPWLYEAAMVGAMAVRGADAEDAARYRWLRADNAYWPEEQGVTGGKELDELIDERMAVKTPSHAELDAFAEKAMERVARSPKGFHVKFETD